MLAVPAEQRGGVGGQAGVGLGEGGGRLAEAEQVGRAVGLGGEDRAVVVEPEQQRLLRRGLAQRDELQAAAGDADAAAAGDDGAGARVLELGGEPAVVACGARPRGPAPRP